ncbi:MAG: GAF domain-containing protein [Planctomycetota bacterium]|nr:MAG: GAF domain-containing protein [Planctomycetota bacterium]
MNAQSQHYCPQQNTYLDETTCQRWEDRQFKAKRLLALERAARHLSSGGKRADILQQVLLELESTIGLRRCTVMVVSGGEDTLFVETSPALPSPTSVRYRRGQGISGKVFASGEPVIVPRLSDEPSFLNMVHHRSDREIAQLAFICVPIFEVQTVVGTLSADVPLASGTGDLAELASLLAIVATMIAHDTQLRRDAQAEQQALQAENIRLRQRLGERVGPGHIIGHSRSFQEALLRIAQVAASESTVLILGESGTGKELAAEAIHSGSPRSSGPLIRVHCAALNDNLLESELFGHEKGAFTGAHATRKGRIEEAAGGTLFLDEIGEFSSAMQTKLLRVLQQKQFERVGSSHTLQTDARIICATNRDLQAMVDAGTFRLDLYYRINVFPVHLPPLRERVSDIIPLAEYFIKKFASRVGKQITRLSTPAINAMLAYHWPGNVRELENCIEHAVVLTSDEVIHQYHLPPSLQMPEAEAQSQPLSLEARVAALERDLISDALKREDGNIAAAARLLGTTPRITRYKARSLGLLES